MIAGDHGVFYLILFAFRIPWCSSASSYSSWNSAVHSTKVLSNLVQGKSFIIPISLHPDGVNLRYFKLGLFDPLESIV